MRMLVVIIGVLSSVSVSLSQVSDYPPEKPKLIVSIVVEQMRYEYLFRYWDKFGDEGFKKMVNAGTFCKNANYNYLFTQSDAGMATIYTGSNPSNHGIISNNWYNRLAKEMEGAVEDKEMKTVGGNYASGTKSPGRLFTTTFQDELKLSNYHKSKVIGIALKGSSAVLSGGILADEAYWYDDVNGDWISSSYYLDSLPAWVNVFNKKELSTMYLTKDWTTLLPLEEYTESLSDTNDFEKGIRNQSVFPYNLHRLSRKPGNLVDYGLLAYTPYGNVLTKDFAIQAIVNEELGKDEYTDVISISFSATDYIGKTFGPSSVEIQDAYLRLDKNLAHLIKFIEEEVGKKNTLFLLTSNHGVAHIPKYLQSMNIPVDYFRANSMLVLLRAYLNAVYGQGDWIQAYYHQQLYLNRQLIEDSGLSLEEMQDKVASFLIQLNGIANTVTSTTLAKTNYTDGILRKMQNSFNQMRSGDVIINLKPGWVEKDDFSTGNNSANDYDSHVPLVWYGWKVKRAVINEEFDMTRITPTICFWMNIPYPPACTGKPFYQLME